MKNLEPHKEAWLSEKEEANIQRKVDKRKSPDDCQMLGSICSGGPAAFPQPGYSTLVWQPIVYAAPILLKLVWLIG